MCTRSNHIHGILQEDARVDAEEKFYQDTLNKELQLNVEYRSGNVEAVTLLYKDSKDDVGQSLVSEGLVTVEKRKEKRLAKLVGDYSRSQEKAKKAHVRLSLGSLICHKK